jgi:hypothetical protein
MHPELIWLGNNHANGNLLHGRKGMTVFVQYFENMLTNSVVVDRLGVANDKAHLVSHSSFVLVAIGKHNVRGSFSGLPGI